MASLDNVSSKDLRQDLAEVKEKKPTQRLIAAINSLEEDDATLEEVSQRYRYTAGWLSQWLDRLERLAGEPFEAVVYDQHRSDRPSRLSEEEYDLRVADAFRKVVCWEMLVPSQHPYHG